MLEEFCEIFEYLQGSFLSSPTYQMKRSKKRDTMIESFLNKNNLDDIRKIWGYLVFCFVFFESKKTRFNVMPLNNVTNKNAFKQYINRSSEMDFTVEKIKLLKGLKNPLSKVLERFQFEPVFLEEQRKKYFNQPKGFIHCDSFGRGFLYDRGKCITCKYKRICENKE